MLVQSPELFGSGSYVGTLMAAERDFSALPAAQQATYLGWIAGCPVVQELISPDNRGPEAMVKRYGEVAFWFGQISREVAAVNEPLARRLTSSWRRVTPPLKYEADSVPGDSYTTRSSPMSQLTGYALPRLVIDYLDDDAAGGTKIQRLSMARNIIASSAGSEDAKGPLSFMATVAGRLVEAGGDPDSVLKHVLGSGWVAEHNDMHEVISAEIALNNFAPDIIKRFYLMTPEEKATLNLV